MKKTIKRSGFTIVELVIVIAVIAVLAGVLIPTFGGIIERANESNDVQVVATVNKLLVVDNIIKGDDPNDAVEIKKMLKDNGVSLKTKSEGKYIWYDIDQNKVILAGLNESGIVFLNDNDKDPKASASKGKFNADTTAPETFIDGYIFLSEEADGDLAENISALRNPTGDTSDEVKDSLKKTLNKIKNAKLKETLTTMLNTTAVMAENGVTGFIGDRNSSVTRVIISSKMTNISKDTIDTVLDYTNIVAVYFHSGVVSADADAITELKGRTEKPYFVYVGAELEKIDKDNSDIAYLISKDESGEYITHVYVENVITGVKNQIAEFNKKDEVYTFSYILNFKYLPGTATESYDFVAYSFYRDGSNPLELGEKTYSLNSTEKLLVDDEGNLIIYLVCTKEDSDFKIGNDYYSSKTVTHMLANNKLPSGTTNITVVSTGAEFVKLNNEETKLTLPENVELLVPTVNYNVVEETNKDGNKTGNLILGDALNNYGKFPTTHKYNNKDDYDVLIKGSYSAINKNGITGETKLTIKSGVELDVKADASIYVDAILFYAGTRYQCFINNKCGVLDVEDGAKITSSGNITSYGIIRGDGEIEANRGTVSEIMTIFDWYGGSNAAVSVGTKSDDDDWVGGLLGNLGGLATDLDLSGKHVCPFNEWKADNISVKTTIKKDCEYKTITGIFLSKPVVVDDFVLASSNGNPLFVMGSDAYIEKTVGKVEDKDGNIIGLDDVKLTLHGTISDTNKTMTIPNIVSSVAVTINFANIPMPLSHFDVHVATGSTLTVSKNLYKLLPGSDIVVDGTLYIQGNAQVVMWNSNDVRFSPDEFITEEQKFLGFGGRNKITLNLTLDKKKVTGITTVEQRKYPFGDWSDHKTTVTGFDDEKKYISVIYQFSESTPAKLVVNGTLNIAGGNRFAGDITSEKKDGKATITTIKDTGAVKGCEFSMGWFIQNATLGNSWYDTYVDGIRKQVYLNGTPIELNGTYQYTKADGETDFTWKEK